VAYQALNNCQRTLILGISRYTTLELRSLWNDFGHRPLAVRVRTVIGPAVHDAQGVIRRTLRFEVYVSPSVQQCHGGIQGSLLHTGVLGSQAMMTFPNSHPLVFTLQPCKFDIQISHSQFSLKKIWY
jgi:hypothetical protein